MRRLELSERKKLRGVPRRLRALSKWADAFSGYYYPADGSEKYCHWKIPVLSSLVNPPQTNKSIQSQCMGHMLRAASLLAASVPEGYSEYYKIACLFVFPYFHQSEVTIFYDAKYYLRFFGESHQLSPRSITSEFEVALPAGFVERGCLVEIEGGEQEEWWCIGQET